ncbi:MAG: transcriptional regulator [Actinomycetota bacterium]
MRADRLVAVLLLLQAKGRVTAREVADELEISERTARRDLDALIVAGLPVYSRQGRGGGWRLLGGGRTDLTGLASAEARALLTMAAATGGATPEFASAMRKITQAMPAPVRDEAQRAIDSVMTDDAPWGNPQSILSEPRNDRWLDDLQRAVLERRRVLLTYDAPRSGRSERPVDPLGLVTKRGTWYLLADTQAGSRSFRVNRVVTVEAGDEFFEPPPDFDLAEAWEEITTGYVERSSRVTCRAHVEPWAVDPLRAMGVEASVLGEIRDGRLEMELGGGSVEALAAQIAGLVGPIELVDPSPDLVGRLVDAGERLVALSRANSPLA